MEEHTGTRRDFPLICMMCDFSNRLNYAFIVNYGKLNY